MFAIVFYIVRIFGWFPVSYCFWSDALYLLFNSDAAMHTMPKWVPAFWLFTHGFLTCLQVCVLCLITSSSIDRPERHRADLASGRGNLHDVAAGRPTFDRHAGVVGLPHPQGRLRHGHGRRGGPKNEAKNVASARAASPSSLRLLDGAGRCARQQKQGGAARYFTLPSVISTFRHAGSLEGELRARRRRLEAEHFRLEGLRQGGKDEPAADHSQRQDPARDHRPRVGAELAGPQQIHLDVGDLPHLVPEAREDGGESTCGHRYVILCAPPACCVSEGPAASLGALRQLEEV